MSDEKRIERLNELARKHWPDVTYAEVLKDGNDLVKLVAWGESFDEQCETLVAVKGTEKALDALEAALLVLNGTETLRETVICAAIRLPDGRVFRGHRHGDCIHTAHALVTYRFENGYSTVEWGPTSATDQGFVTSANRYVDRQEAMRLQLAAGIASVADGGYRGDSLYSEDLY